MPMIRSRILSMAALLLFQTAAVFAQQPAAVPPFVARGQPGPGHQAMQMLAGEWDVEMTLYVGGRILERPVTSRLRTTRIWIAGGRYLRDETRGDTPSGPYYRMGTLGYSNMDRRYEWVTQDAVNSMMMIYLGRPGSGPSFPATMYGQFTDQGLLGERFVGRRFAQRTVITIADADHHTIEIYFTPPGGREILADRKVYTRRR